MDDGTDEADGAPQEGGADHEHGTGARVPA
jgi:hypothetical protein